MRVTIVITQREILVENQKVAAVKRGSVSAELKPNGQSGYLITPLKRAMARQRQRLERLERVNGKGDFTGEFTLVADRHTPYRLLTEVQHSAGQAGFDKMNLLTVLDTVPGTRVRCIAVRAPRYAPRSAPPEHHAALSKLFANPKEAKPPTRPKMAQTATVTPNPTLTVSVSYGGFVASFGGHIIRGADGSGLSVPCTQDGLPTRCSWRFTNGLDNAREIDGYGYRGLKEVAKAVKRRSPSTRTVVVVAERQVPMQVVVRTLDSLRGKAGKGCQLAEGCLFDQVQFSAPVQ